MYNKNEMNCLKPKSIFTKKEFQDSKWAIYHIMSARSIDPVEMQFFEGEEVHIISVHYGWCVIRNKDYEFRFGAMSNGEIVKLYDAKDNILGCINERVVLDFFY